MSEADWRSTLEAAAGGDAAARNQLIERYADRVRSRVHAELEQDFRRNHRWILPLFSTRDVVQDMDAIRAALGEEVVVHYLHAARWEQAECDRRVTDWEVTRGFERA